MKKKVLIISIIIFVVCLIIPFVLLFQDFFIGNNSDKTLSNASDRTVSKEVPIEEKIDLDSYPVLKVALKQEGNVGGEKFWKWYGYDEHVLWCACFVSWCANETGSIDDGAIPMFSNCRNEGIPWFKNRDEWEEPGYTPQPADLIFFDLNQDTVADHVGFVLLAEKDKIYTIEGNAGDVCRQKNYSPDDERIYGYGTPAY